MEKESLDIKKFNFKKDHPYCFYLDVLPEWYDTTGVDHVTFAIFKITDKHLKDRNLILKDIETEIDKQGSYGDYCYDIFQIDEVFEEKEVEVNVKDKYMKDNCFYTALIERDGAIKWKSNGHYLMKDTMENIIANGFSEFNIEATNKKREAQNDKFIGEYRENVKKHKHSEEELAEMRNAFGEETKVVDILTGKTIDLKTGKDVEDDEVEL